MFLCIYPKLLQFMSIGLSLDLKNFYDQKDAYVID